MKKLRIHGDLTILRTKDLDALIAEIEDYRERERRRSACRRGIQIARKLAEEAAETKPI